MNTTLKELVLYIVTWYICHIELYFYNAS
jgi:hypothetical protein